jgi:hypothetical protein
MAWFKINRTGDSLILFKVNALKLKKKEEEVIKAFSFLSLSLCESSWIKGGSQPWEQTPGPERIGKCLPYNLHLTFIQFLLICV